MINYILYRIGEFVALRLPLKTAYKIAAFISDFRYIFAFKDRRRVKENLKAIFPEKTGREIHQIRRQMFRNFAKYLVDFFRFSKINLEYIERDIKIESRRYIDEALAKGKGVVVISAHIGNWELGAVAMNLLGYPLWVVALPHKYKKVDNFFNSQREGKGVKVIPLGRAYRACINIVKKNELVALAGDRDFSKTGGVVVNFFGKKAIFPQGPAALSLRTGAMILPVFVVRNNDDSFTLKCGEPIDSNGKEEMELIDEYKKIIEDYIRQYPDQWYMFRRFWIA